ncbi:MAG: serine/threonine-protein phosphatase [Myxococcales bacterium]|nr:serine/threonine-protein phosphatase [Myxococcales bacterium]
MQLVSTGFSHVGRRANNEDALCVSSDIGLFAVADGMGGTEGGEIASRIAICCLSDNVRDRLTGSRTRALSIQGTGMLAESMIEDAVLAAHEEVRANRIGKLSKMGSTLSALMVQDDRAVIGHIGDSRVYRLRDDVLEQLTQDHSLYEELKAQGHAVGPRRTFPYRNVITQVLGMNGEPRAEVLSVDVQEGDIYLLCTDGLSEVIPEAKIREMLKRLSPEDASEKLVAEALSWGSQDNVTAVVVHVVNAH